MGTPSFFFLKFFIRVCLCRSSSCSKIQMWQKDAAVLSKAAAAESEEGSGDGGGGGGARGGCAVDAAQMGVSLHPCVFFSALPFCVCSKRSMRSPNHPLSPWLLESEAFLAHSSPAPSSASLDCGRRPFYLQPR